jgi:hypothetical protein
VRKGFFKIAVFLWAALPIAAETVSWKFTEIYNGGALGQADSIVIGPGNCPDKGART